MVLKNGRPKPKRYTASEKLSKRAEQARRALLAGRNVEKNTVRINRPYLQPKEN